MNWHLLPLSEIIQLLNTSKQGLNETEAEKKQVLESIFDLYIKKDIIDYLKIDKVLHMKKLIEFLAVNNGQKIKYDKVAEATGLNFLAIKEYIEILKETYIIIFVIFFAWDVIQD